MEKGTDFKKIWLSLLFAMRYHPQNKTMSINSRSQHTFMYIIEGEYEYRFDKQEFTAKADDIIYVPKGATYSYKIISQRAYCYQVEFDIHNSSISYVTHPCKTNTFEGVKDYFEKIINLYNTNDPSSYLEALSCLYKISTLIPTQNAAEKESDSKIQPAIEYIEAHYKEKVDIGYLAKLCFMSESQLRRYFKKEYQMSPITYKNRFRIEKAKSMLLYDIADISKTAERLGFENVYAFSKMFKMYAGLPPSQFAKNKNKTKT